MKEMKCIKEEFLQFVEENKKECIEKENKLKEEERKDEAEFEKIKYNIYEISVSFLGTAVKKAENAAEEEKTEVFFREFIEGMNKLSVSWKIRLEKAKEHNIPEIILIEETKLAAWSRLIEKFEKLREE